MIDFGSYPTVNFPSLHWGLIAVALASQGLIAVALASWGLIAVAPPPPPQSSPPLPTPPLPFFSAVVVLDQVLLFDVRGYVWPDTIYLLEWHNICMYYICLCTHLYHTYINIY